jgi:hypothetical protein
MNDVKNLRCAVVGVCAAALLAACAGPSTSSLDPLAPDQGSARNEAVRLCAGPPVLIRSLALRSRIAPPLHSCSGESPIAPSQAFSRDAFKPPELFVTDFSAGAAGTGEIYDMDGSGTHVRGMYNDCAYPQGAKVDQNANLWVACTGDSTVNEYASGATAKTLALSDVVGSIAYEPADVAIDGNGNVYATNICCAGNNDITYWLAGNVCNGCVPSGVVSLNPATTNNRGYFTDVYRAPNQILWADYFGCVGSICDPGLEEIDSPQGPPSKIAWKGAIPLGGMQFPGGVYETNAPLSLDVLDQSTKIITQYSTAAVPYAANFAYPAVPACDPVSFGVNKPETHFAVADACTPAVVVGETKRAKQMTWTVRKNAAFVEPIGAAFRPSDK